MIRCTEYSHPLTDPRWGDYGPWRCRCGRYRGYAPRNGRATNATEKSGPIDKRLVVHPTDSNNELISFVLRNRLVEIEWCFNEDVGETGALWIKDGLDIRWNGFPVIQWVGPRDPMLIEVIARRFQEAGFRTEMRECQE